MKIHKGEHSTEAGPIKSVVLGIGGFFTIGSVIVFFTGNAGDSTGSVFIVGLILLGIGLMLPDKNVVKW